MIGSCVQRMLGSLLSFFCRILVSHDIEPPATNLTLQLRESEERLRLVLEGAELGYWDWNIETGNVERNARWAEMLGYTREEIANTTKQWTDFIYVEDREKAWKSIEDTLEGRSPAHKLEYRMLHKDGSIRWILDQANVVRRDKSGKPIRMSGTHLDITLHKEMEAQIKQLAFYDVLTGLANRRLLFERLNHFLTSCHRSGKKGALFFIDMDNFKNLNDTLGHDMGDLLLQQVAERLVSCVRENDTVSRLGGDEFVVMLEDLNGQSTKAIAEVKKVGNKILTTLNQNYQLGIHNYHSTPSIGATLFDGLQKDINILIKQADDAMYQAKKSGQNTLRFYDENMNIKHENEKI